MPGARRLPSHSSTTDLSRTSGRARTRARACRTTTLSAALRRVTRFQAARATPPSTSRCRKRRDVHPRSSPSCRTPRTATCCRRSRCRSRRAQYVRPCQQATGEPDRLPALRRPASGATIGRVRHRSRQRARMRILLAEDDALLGDAVARHLRQHGHAVDWVRDGGAADAALRAQSFDLVVLDLGLPNMPGRTVLSKLRDRSDATPVLIITAHDAVADRVEGLDAGADEHLCSWDDDVSTNAIEVYVHRLRKKLAPAAIDIVTVRGLGYYLPKA